MVGKLLHLSLPSADGQHATGHVSFVVRERVACLRAAVDGAVVAAVVLADNCHGLL